MDRLARALMIATLPLALAHSALAGDGVLEINQTCAVQTGCFVGDDAGFPVTISASGSYRLSSNLVVPDENTHGISLDSTNDVTIDLSGFSISGPVSCSGSPTTCAPSGGTGSGIRSSAISTGVAVHGGTILGMGFRGVELGIQADVRNLRVRSNRDDGIFVGSGSTVSDSTARQNGRNGIFTGTSSTVSGNTVLQNGFEGISANVSTVVVGNAAYLNGQNGIDTLGSATITGNTTYQNVGIGIATNDGSRIFNNTSRQNGSHGIEATQASTVSGNAVVGNSGFGLRFANAGNSYFENIITNNVGGTISGGSSADFGSNICNGSSVCP